MERLTWTITEAEETWRVDEVLRQRLYLSNTAIKVAKGKTDGILLDGKTVFVNIRVAEGQVLTVDVERSTTGKTVATPGEVDVVYEDEYLLVVNKASGVPVHEGGGNHTHTLANFMMDYYEKQGKSHGFHPVNRLDRGTSGLLVVARNPHIQERLKGQVERHYLAVTALVPPVMTGRIDAPIRRQEGSVLRREVGEGGRPAVTRYTVKEVWGERALVELKLESGRTHQIRVHMAHIGCPLVGDFLYGVEDKNLIERPALHSHSAIFAHPMTGQIVQCRSPLPQDMARLKTV